ncbi:MAG: hypothetical protein IPM39_16685 [Chloroflexi bacterium]|nr:hypothetical protein [Chloroflexota bacterium]
MSYGNFDALQRPQAITYPTGEVVTVDYDREGENSLTAGDNELVTNIRYNAMGQMTFLERDGNIADTTYAYHPQNDGPNVGGTGDSNFRLMTIQHGSAGAGDGDAWPDFTYEYDRVGNITKMTTASNTGTDIQDFSYDHLNRLVSATGNGVTPTYSAAYVYNQIGNITSFDGAAYTYSTAHKHAVATANGVTYSYDANGCQYAPVNGSPAFDVVGELSGERF